MYLYSYSITSKSSNIAILPTIGLRCHPIRRTSKGNYQWQILLAIVMSNNVISSIIRLSTIGLSTIGLSTIGLRCQLIRRPVLATIWSTAADPASATCSCPTIFIHSLQLYLSKLPDVFIKSAKYIYQICQICQNLSCNLLLSNNFHSFCTTFQLPPQISASSNLPHQIVTYQVPFTHQLEDAITYKNPKSHDVLSISCQKVLSAFFLWASPIQKFSAKQLCFSITQNVFGFQCVPTSVRDGSQWEKNIKMI